MLFSVLELRLGLTGLLCGVVEWMVVYYVTVALPRRRCHPKANLYITPVKFLMNREWDEQEEETEEEVHYFTVTKSGKGEYFLFLSTATFGIWNEDKVFGFEHRYLFYLLFCFLYLFKRDHKLNSRWQLGDVNYDSNKGQLQFQISKPLSKFTN